VLHGSGDLLSRQAVRVARDEATDLLARSNDRRFHLQHAVQIVGEPDVDFLSRRPGRQASYGELAQVQIVFHAPAFALIHLHAYFRLVWIDCRDAPNPAYRDGRIALQDRQEIAVAVLDAE